ncbi:MAG: hypothetical protein CME65_15455 [Halobacteriovoraceae bacterium]|nr:hypothetical protein [Halobacteriovoraceae bacterium]|tara:strand:- start:8502 stop:9296 length:795 start_codon:yes stop_codon:yes gene_type:complete
MLKKSRIAILLILLVSCLLIFLIYLVSLYSDVSLLKNHYPVYSLENQRYELQKTKPEHWVAHSEVSHNAKWAIIVSEDWAFFDHYGIDVNQLEKVIEESLEEQSFVRGASTITQQVVKNALLTPEKTLVRKFNEILMALMLEKILSKDEILEHYLNLIELGEDLYGIKAASQFYFQKKPSKLNAKEGAFLAMLLPSPVRYSQSYRNQKLTEFAKSQIEEILIKLRQARVLTEEQRQVERRRVLSFEVMNYFGEDLLSIEKELGL